MSSQLPPDPFFNNINFNPSFFIDNDPFLTEAMANFLYLKLTGGNITGNLGIGTTPLAKLHIVEPTGTPASANNGTIIIDHNNNGGASSIVFRSARDRGSDYGYIQYQDALTVGGEGDAAKLIIGTQNDSIDDILLLPSGNVGIKATNPPSLLTVNPAPTDTNSFDFSTSPATITNTTATGTSILNDPRPILHLCRPGQSGQAFASRATFSLCRFENNASNSRTRLDLGLTNDQFNEVNVMSFRSDGRVGIGTTNPISRFTLKTSYGDDTTGLCLDANDGNTYNLKIYSIIAGAGRINWNFQVNNITSSTNALTIRNNGNVGIGNTDPGNIFAVGSGERLKISNGNSDFTQIGTSDTTGVNNTCILLSGSTRSTNAGCIEYQAVNNHLFFSSKTGSYNATLDIDPDEVKILKSCTTYNANFFTEGEFLSYQTKTNTSSQSRSGYFYSTEWWFNSCVNLAISHTSPNYTLWHGHVGTNNNTQILYAVSISASNMVIEGFTEQGTNKVFLYMYPTISYTTSVQLRIKFFG